MRETNLPTLSCWWDGNLFQHSNMDMGSIDTNYFLNIIMRTWQNSAKYTTNTGIYYIMYTTASHQYRQGKIGKLPLRKCAISYAQEKDPSKINTPFWIANSLHAACCRSVGTTKHGQYLLFCTFGTRTISKFCSSHTAITYLPPLHHLECQTSPLHATPQGSCSRNAPAEEAPGEELQHG